MASTPSTHQSSSTPRRVDPELRALFIEALAADGQVNCPNPAEAMDVALAAETIVSTDLFDNLSLDLVHRSVEIVGSGFKADTFDALVAVLARRPEVADAIVAEARPSAAALAAVCQMHIFWYTNNVTFLIAECEVRAPSLTEFATRGRCGPAGAACADSLPRISAHPAEIAHPGLLRSDAEWTANSVKQCGAGPRAVLIAEALCANPATPSDVKDSMHTILTEARQVTHALAA